MVYRNKGGQPREKAMLAAYALVTKFGAKQEHVALVLGCSQPTIHSWVKEMSLRNQISSLEKQLNDSNGYIKDLQDEIQHLRYLEHDDDDDDDDDDE